MHSNNTNYHCNIVISTRFDAAAAVVFVVTFLSLRNENKIRIRNGND